MQWTEECLCNLGKPNFDVVEFNTTRSRIELLCGKCHSMICWWPISTEQKKKSLVIQEPNSVGFINCNRFFHKISSTYN
jgi:hypothetical protein